MTSARQFKRYLAAAMFVVAMMAGCTKRNPNVCCTTQADCDATGLPGPTPCAEDGLVCIRNVCGTPNDCQATSDCSSPLVCDVRDGICVQCVDSSTCGDEVCDEATHSCRDCVSDDECGGGYCSTSSRTCRESITPAFVPHACDEPTVAAQLSIGADTTISSDDASSCTGGVLAQTAGPPICVMHYAAITVTSGVALTIRGSNAVALVADGDVTIGGTLDLDANIASNGPGGGTVVSGGQPETLVGGGGAGLATNGGAGGGTVDPGGAANGGASAPSSIVSLLGGRRASGPGGGGGGGAATIVACRGSAIVTGVLSAVGGGGDRGNIQVGGFGGGSGGYIAVQGRSVSITGQAYANGGSGGSGGLNASLGVAGNNGPRSIMCPQGHLSGSGGCIDAVPGDGDPSELLGFDTRQPNAGGGSVGFLTTFTLTDLDAVIAPSAASPGIVGITFE